MEVLTRPYHVLFLGTRNSGRTILAEVLMNRWGGVRFHGFSAGSRPQGCVHPIALELLKQMRLPTEGLRSKSWDEFADPHGIPLDFVFTVYDFDTDACPYWPGQPLSAHWLISNPETAGDSEAERWAAFRATFRELENRIRILVSLPREGLDPVKLQSGARVSLTPAPAAA
jgi:protein-tyrosine-phosphatase